MNITTSNPQNTQLKSVAKMIGKVYNTDLMLKWTLGLPASRVAQWKRAGPITQRSVDRNHALLVSFGARPSPRLPLPTVPVFTFSLLSCLRYDLPVDWPF